MGTCMLHMLFCSRNEDKKQKGGVPRSDIYAKKNTTPLAHIMRNRLMHACMHACFYFFGRLVQALCLLSKSIGFHSVALWKYYAASGLHILPRSYVYHLKNPSLVSSCQEWATRSFLGSLPPLPHTYSILGELIGGDSVYALCLFGKCGHHSQSYIDMLEWALSRKQIRRQMKATTLGKQGDQE